MAEILQTIQRKFGEVDYGDVRFDSVFIIVQEIEVYDILHGFLVIFRTNFSQIINSSSNTGDVGGVNKEGRICLSKRVILLFITLSIIRKGNKCLIIKIQTIYQQVDKKSFYVRNGMLWGKK